MASLTAPAASVRNNDTRYKTRYQSVVNAADCERQSPRSEDGWRVPSTSAGAAEPVRGYSYDMRVRVVRQVNEQVTEDMGGVGTAVTPTYL